MSSGYDPSKSRPPTGYNPLLSASLQVDDFAARIMPAAPPPPVAEVKPVIYGSPMTTTATATTPDQMSTITGGGGAVREDTFSDISLAPSTTTSTLVANTPVQLQTLNPLEDLDAFGSQGGSVDIPGGQRGGGDGGMGNTATEMLINQASSITANFQQALPAVASTVFSHFSNYMKGGTQQGYAKPQEHHYDDPMPVAGGIPQQPQQYVSPLDDIYQQQMSNPTESVNQMPLFISPQDAPSQPAPSLAAPPTGAQNTYRIGGLKKKSYAPPPIQGFSAQGPGSFTPGYDPTMPMQSAAPPIMPPMPPMPGQEGNFAIKPPGPTPPPPVISSSPALPLQQRPPSVNQPPEMFSQQHHSATPSPAPPPALFMPPPPPVDQTYQQPQPPLQSFFQPPPSYDPPKSNPEPEKSKFSISSFFTSNPIIDRLQGKTQTSSMQQEQDYSGFGGIGMGQEVAQPVVAQSQPPVAFNPQFFNTNPIQAPVGVAPPSSGGAFNNPPMAYGNPTPPPPQGQQYATPMQLPSSGPINPGQPPLMTSPPPMQEPPKIQPSGSYRMNKSSRPAYANPNLIAQSNTTSGFVVSDRTCPGQVPPPTQWFNPATAAQSPVPDVTNASAAVMEPVNLIEPPITPTFPMPTIPDIPVASVTAFFTPPTLVEQVPVIPSSTPDLVVPRESIQQGFAASFFNKEVNQAQPDVVAPPPPSAATVAMPFVVQGTSDPKPTLFSPMVGQAMENLKISTPDLVAPPPLPENAFNQNYFVPTANPPEKIESKDIGFNPSVLPPTARVPSSFFDSAFSGPSQGASAAAPQRSNDSFQPVNFFNAFNAPSSGAGSSQIIRQDNPVAQVEPEFQLDGNANVKTIEPTPNVPIAANSWTDNNANVDSVASPAPTVMATSTEQSEDDFLSSFEKVEVDDINAKFFDSPPDVKPTDPIANPNFFQSFMKAKFNAEKLGDEFNDQSLVVEPPSHDDSSISCASFPSFDQSSALLGNVTESGFQVNPPFDELTETMSRMSTSPSIPLPSGMDGLPTVTRSRSGSVSSQVSTNRASSAVMTGPYRPIYKHWFYNQKEANGKVKWVPMSMTDSLALETAFLDASYDQEKLISTDGGRHDVDISSRKRKAVYWSAEENDVRRCSWFYKTQDCRFVPFDEDVADLLEQEYKEAYDSKQWQRKVTLPNGEMVNFHDANVMVHFIATTDSGWGNATGQTTMKRVVKRGVDEFNIEDGEPEKIDHVLFMVHGIGAACDLKFRSVEEVVDEFRSIAHQMVQSHYRSSYDSGEIGRIEVLPISWHSELHSEESGIDAKLKAITLESIPKIRSLANETILDVLFYTSPKFCQHIMEIVSGSLNRLYTKFLQRNPAFTGGISLAGHSLGSLILFDLLSHQKAEPENQENLATREGGGEQQEGEPTNYMMGHAGTGQPFISYPQLLFQARNFFALGSPIGMFVTVRGIDELGLDFKLPTCERFFNIFHPYDPVAYRIESLVNGECSSLQPVLIPHHKGRKRMHLELRETMERVKGDLKARIINTFKTTLETVTQFKAFSRTDTSCIASEVDKVLDEQLQMNGNGSIMTSGSTTTRAGGSTELASPATPNPSTATNSDIDPGETELSLGRLNQGRRIDYVLQEAPLEFFNGYLFALTSHVCYWESEDTTLFVVKEIYSSMGVRTDSKIPQHSMIIERPTY